MRNVVAVGLALIWMALALPAAAQEEGEEGVVGILIQAKPKAGMTDEWVEGAKKHMEFHRQKGDPWEWHVWQISSGEHVGDFVIGSFEHKWSDFDNMPVSEQEDMANWKATLEAYTESENIKYITDMPEHSVPPAKGTPPSKLLTLTTVYAKPEKVSDYMNAVSKIPEALAKAESKTKYYFSRVVAGGRQPAFLVWFINESWASMAPSGTPFRKMLEDAYGPTEADSILDSLANASYGSSTTILSYRSDLSYVPSSPSSR